MELVFLERCYRWVRTEGVLVFVIPVNALNSCARLLASQFNRISLFRLEHADCIRFHQIVVFGSRKKSHARGEPRGVGVFNLVERQACEVNGSRWRWWNNVALRHIFIERRDRTRPIT